MAAEICLGTASAVMMLAMLATFPMDPEQAAAPALAEAVGLVPFAIPMGTAMMS